MNEYHAALVAEWRQRRLNRLQCEHRAYALAWTYAMVNGHDPTQTANLRAKAQDRLRRVRQQEQLIKDKAL